MGRPPEEEPEDLPVQYSIGVFGQKDDEQDSFRAFPVYPFVPVLRKLKWFMRLAWVTFFTVVFCSAASLAAQQDSVRREPHIVHEPSIHGTDTTWVSYWDSVPVYPLPKVEIASMRIQFVRESGYGTCFSGYTPDETTLRQMPNASAADALAANSAGFVKGATPGMLATMSIRGSDAGHLPVYWDDIPVTSPMLGVSDLAQMPLSMMGGWSLAKGGASLGSGTGGLGGAINFGATIDPTKGWPQEFHHVASAEMGSFGTWKGSLASVYPVKKVMFRTGLFHVSSQNDYPFINHALADAPVERLQNANLRQDVVQQDISARLPRRSGTSDTWVFVKSWYANSFRELPSPMTVTPTGETQADESLRLMAGIQRSGMRLKYGVKVASLRERLRYIHPLAGYNEPSSQNTWAAHAFVNHYTDGFFEGSVQEFKVRVMQDAVNTTAFGGWLTQPSATASLSSETALSNNFAVSTILREEWVAHQWSPLLGAIGTKWIFTEVVKIPLALKGNLSRNYRFPTLNMRYWNPGGNPDLQPEQSYIAEAGLVLGPENRPYVNGKSKRFLLLSATGFLSRVTNWIQWLPGQGNIWSPVNIREVSSRGVETKLKCERDLGHNQVEFTAQYTYTDARTVASALANDPSVDKQLFYVPVHQASSSLRFTRGQFWFIVREQVTGVRYTTPDNLQWLPAYHLLSASAGYDLKLPRSKEKREAHSICETLTIQLGVQNLLNADYQVIAWRPMPGRNYTLTLTWNFHDPYHKY